MIKLSMCLFRIFLDDKFKKCKFLIMCITRYSTRVTVLLMVIKPVA